MSIEVAVIPAAGRGTRMRPATRVVPKALLSVVDRPAVQYGVEEAARAGAKEAIVVVDLDTGHLISQHFTIEGPLPGLEDIRIRPAVQEEPLGLGHAVFEAREMVGDRPFLCILSDNIVRPGHDVLPALADGSEDGSVSVMCLREYGDEFLDKYGFVIPASDVEGGYLDLAGSIEKPGKDRAPSNLGLVGRYVFTPEIFSILEKTPPGALDEIQLTDGINQLGERGRLRGYVSDTDLLDVGTPAGLLKATVELGLHQFGSDFKDFLDGLVGE
ncbi:MAG: UTP--glucose-1-phosphate uridylyltransferase [Actinobacteria bacterium]|nr:MAG: UTP--glucose-1-phosphate uridylyltransferase [Actinomycetota bacterium]